MVKGASGNQERCGIASKGGSPVGPTCCALKLPVQGCEIQGQLMMINCVKSVAGWIDLLFGVGINVEDCDHCTWRSPCGFFYISEAKRRLGDSLAKHAISLCRPAGYSSWLLFPFPH